MHRLRVYRVCWRGAYCRPAIDGRSLDGKSAANTELEARSANDPCSPRWCLHVAGLCGVLARHDGKNVVSTSAVLGSSWILLLEQHLVEFRQRLRRHVLTVIAKRDGETEDVEVDIG